MDHVLDLQALEASDLRELDSMPSVDSTVSILLCD
ncbi:SapB/AmfS family lanthipeptide [Lentzea sp. NPDC005914]